MRLPGKLSFAKIAYGIVICRRRDSGSSCENYNDDEKFMGADDSKETKTYNRVQGDATSLLYLPKQNCEALRLQARLCDLLILLPVSSCRLRSSLAILGNPLR